jgi:hypothetical protein
MNPHFRNGVAGRGVFLEFMENSSVSKGDYIRGCFVRGQAFSPVLKVSF